MIRIENENTQSDAMSKTLLLAKPTDVSAPARKMKPTTRGLRLSYRDTSHPETGKPINELIGMKSNTVPSCASLKSKNVLMVGIRDAHEEKQNPDRKK